MFIQRLDPPTSPSFNFSEPLQRTNICNMSNAQKSTSSLMDIPGKNIKYANNKRQEFPFRIRRSTSKKEIYCDMNLGCPAWVSTCHWLFGNFWYLRVASPWLRGSLKKRYITMLSSAWLVAHFNQHTECHFGTSKFPVLFGGLWLASHPFAFDGSSPSLPLRHVEQWRNILETRNEYP